MSGDKKIPFQELKSSNEESKETEEESKTSPAEPLLSPAEVDARLEEAFLRVFLECISEKDHPFPMEPSTLLRDYLAQFTCPVVGRLMIQDSSYKKVSRIFC